MKYKLLLVILLCFICTGCWNYHELSDFVIITGLGVDKDNTGYKLSVMIANASSNNSSTKEGQATASVVTGVGDNITNAINDIEKKIPKDIYLGHLSMLLINEDIAKDDIYDILDPILRNPEAINKMYLVIVKDNTCEDVLKTLSPLESFPSQNIITNLQNASNDLGYITDVLVSKFIGNVLDEGIENIVPSITIEGNPTSTDNTEDLKEAEVKSFIKLANLAIFNDYKLINYVDEDTSKGINIINNNINSFNITSSCYMNNNKYIVSKIDSPKTKIELKKINNKYKYIFNIELSGSINETNCDLNLNKDNVIQEISNTVKSNIYEFIDEAIISSKKNKSDIFGLGKILYKKDYKFYNKIKDNYYNYYENIDYEINIKLDLKTKGSLKNTLKEQESEKN